MSGAPSSSESAAGRYADVDLDAFIANYSGTLRIERLTYIARQAPELACDAYHMALSLLKKTRNTQLYQELCHEAQKKFGDDAFPIDSTWVEEQDSAAKKQREKLDEDLATYRGNMIRESIRMGHNDLAEFYFDRGEYDMALKDFLRTRDYCTAPKHVIAMSNIFAICGPAQRMPPLPRCVENVVARTDKNIPFPSPAAPLQCLNVIRASLSMRKFSLVLTYATKARNERNSKEDSRDACRVSQAAAVAHLSIGSYQDAAKELLSIHAEEAEENNEILALQDVGTMGALCALATMDRQALRTQVAEGSSFKHVLEVVPPVRDLVHDFLRSRYTACLAALDKIRPALELDMYLGAHVDVLYALIRKRAIVQYFSPFDKVSLAKMGHVFGTSETEMEDEVSALIVEDKIQGRIDGHNKVLYASESDIRSEAFSRALSTASRYEENAHAVLLRMNLTRCGYVYDVRDGGDEAMEMRHETYEGGMASVIAMETDE